MIWNVLVSSIFIAWIYLVAMLIAMFKNKDVIRDKHILFVLAHPDDECM